MPGGFPLTPTMEPTAELPAEERSGDLFVTVAESQSVASEEPLRVLPNFGVEGIRNIPPCFARTRI